ncbi:hypothetical protein [Paenibacillus sp. AN1007]|uniref:Uncharacterized protein n=1 Tax=Paenibacillus sp. AN1007 TaxID=3151385 RepID=A0AAU8NA27_9BACL
MPGIDNYSLNNYGIDGFDKNADLELIASGTLTNDTSLMQTYRFVDDTSNGLLPFLKVDYPFGSTVPNIVIASFGTGTRAMLIRGLKNSNGNFFVLFFTGNSLAELSSRDDTAYINSSGFRIPVNVSGANYTWKAYV